MDLTLGKYKIVFMDGSSIVMTGRVPLKGEKIALSHNPMKDTFLNTENPEVGLSYTYWVVDNVKYYVRADDWTDSAEVNGQLLAIYIYVKKV